jgi:hypothetical protein
MQAKHICATTRTISGDTAREPMWSNQHPDGLTAREIREATGLSKHLTASAISGLFTRGILHKRGHRYGLTAPEDALDGSQRS